MTNKEIEPLLLDLSYRLPHGVKFHYFSEFADGEDPEFDNTITTIDMADWQILDEDHNEWIRVRQIMPYLRPMSSMTEEEKKDILQSLNIHGDIDNEGNLLLGVECNIITLKVCKKYLGELNKRMFDVCHMIEKGLALEAPDGMYKF